MGRKRKPQNSQADYKDGYTRIPNLVLEALPLARLNGTQLSICMQVLRRTNGWNRANDSISLSDFAATGRTTTAYVSRQISQLLSKNMIRRLEYKPGKKAVYSFVTNVAEWEGGDIILEKVAANRAKGVYRGPKDNLSGYPIGQVQGLHESAGVDCGGVSQPTINGLSQPTTVTLSDPAIVDDDSALTVPEAEPDLKKDINTFEIHSSSLNREREPFILSELLLAKIKENLPGFKSPDLQYWAKIMEQIIREDRRAPDEVREVILFAQSNPFWQTNTLGVDRLRKHYDRINMMRIQERDRPDQRGMIRGKKSYAPETDEYDSFFH